MEEIHSLQQLLDSVRDQVSEGIAHHTYDFMTENYHVLYVDLLERIIRQEDVWKDSQRKNQ